MEKCHQDTGVQVCQHLVGGTAKLTLKSRLSTSLLRPDWRDRFLSCDTTTTPSRVSWQSSSKISARWAMELWEQQWVGEENREGPGQVSEGRHWDRIYGGTCDTTCTIPN